MDHDHTDVVSPKPEGPQRRRRLLQALAVGGVSAAVLPEKWVKPVIDAVIVPAHAAGSVVQINGIYSNQGFSLGSTSGYLERFAGFFISSAHAQTASWPHGNTQCVSFDFGNNPNVAVAIIDGSLMTGTTVVFPNNVVQDVTIGNFGFTGMTVTPTSLNGLVAYPNANVTPEVFSLALGSGICGEV